MLWDEVAQAMSAVHFGPSDTGYAGQVYQRMLWHKIASKDFAHTDQGLTRETLAQLMPHAAPASTSDALSTRAGIGQATPMAPAAAASPGASADSIVGWAHRIWGGIEGAAKRLDVPAKALLAQAALETGWGHHVLGNNVFGVKARGEEPQFTALTHEFADGVLEPVRAAFRSYGSVSQAVNEFVQLVLRAHPKARGQASVAGYAQAMQASGYATDPRYAAKLEAVAASPRMQAVLRSLQAQSQHG